MWLMVFNSHLGVRGSHNCPKRCECVDACGLHVFEGNCFTTVLGCQDALTSHADISYHNWRPRCPSSLIHSMLCSLPLLRRAWALHLGHHCGQNCGQLFRAIRSHLDLSSAPSFFFCLCLSQHTDNFDMDGQRKVSVSLQKRVLHR